MDDNKVREIVGNTIKAYMNNGTDGIRMKDNDICCDKCEVPVEASGRHVHLSRQDIDVLFGKGYELKKAKDISQPGQFMCQERLTIIGPKGQFKNVALLGPERENTQVEISMTDSRSLGIEAKIRMSGDLRSAEDIFIMYEGKMICAEKSAIIAQNHVHMTMEDGKRFNVSNGQRVNIRMNTERPLMFFDVPVRISDCAKLAMHIDFDEANAAGFNNGDKGQIIENSFVVENRSPDMLSVNKPCESAEYVLKGKLLTENEIRKAIKEKADIIVIKKGSLIGPMAKDFLREKGLKTRYV